MATQQLKCPSCDWDGSADDGWFRLIDPPVSNEHRVEGFNQRGVLQVSADDAVCVEDSSIAPRIRCGNCLVEFELPADITVEMV